MLLGVIDLVRGRGRAVKRQSFQIKVFSRAVRQRVTKLFEVSVRLYRKAPSPSELRLAPGSGVQCLCQSSVAVHEDRGTMRYEQHFQGQIEKAPEGRSEGFVVAHRCLGARGGPGQRNHSD